MLAAANCQLRKNPAERTGPTCVQIIDKSVLEMPHCNPSDIPDAGLQLISYDREPSSMMNLQLLLLGTSLSGNATYTSMALSHSNKTIANHVRPEDGSTFHVVDYSASTGQVLWRGTAQGYSNSSCVMYNKEIYDAHVHFLSRNAQTALTGGMTLSKRFVTPQDLVSRTSVGHLRIRADVPADKRIGVPRYCTQHRPLLHRSSAI